MIPLIGLCVAVASAAASETQDGREPHEFKRWGLGWQKMPLFRYRTPGGWVLTLRVDGKHDTREQLGDSPWSSWDEATEWSEGIETVRHVGLDLAWDYHIVKGVHLAPVAKVWHHYNLGENSSTSLYVDYSDESFEYYSRRAVVRSEAYGLGLGFRPSWRPHPRLSLETNFHWTYTISHARDRSDSFKERSEIETEYESSSRSWKTNGWDFDNRDLSLFVDLAIFFYF